MVSIRKAEARDARSIRTLIYRVGINPMSLVWQRFLVAVDEQDRLVGCGQVKPHGDGTRELASIAVQPEWRRRGIGTAIIDRLLAEYPLPLYLTCRASLQPYYERFGFTAVAVTEMTPYFRRIFRIVSFLKRLFPRMEGMRVMVKAHSRSLP